MLLASTTCDLSKASDSLLEKPTFSVGFMQQHAFWAGDPERLVLRSRTTEQCVKAANGPLRAAGGRMYKGRALMFRYAQA